MNIMIAAGYSAPKSGNFIASLITLGRRLKELHHNVVFVFPQKRDWYDWFVKEDLQINIVNADISSGENQFIILKDLLLEYQVDLLHIHFSAFRTAVTKRRAELPDVKIIVHDHMDFSVNRPLITQYLRIALMSAEYKKNDINVISVMERKTKAYLFCQNKWFIPNGLSLERFVQHSMTRNQCRTLLGLKESDIVCLLLGWNPQIKGLDIALKAVQKCREVNPNICLGIIGAGVGKPKDNTKKFIERECKMSATEPWIKYFDSFEDMFAVHKAVDVYLSTSRRDAFSYGLLEAISQNKPVVISDIPGTRWALEYSKCFVHSVGKINECASRIFEAIDAGTDESNYQQIVEKYSIEVWCNRVLSVYSLILGSEQAFFGEIRK